MTNTRPGSCEILFVHVCVHKQCTTPPHPTSHHSTPHYTAYTLQATPTSGSTTHSTTSSCTSVRLLHVCVCLSVVVGCQSTTVHYITHACHIIPHTLTHHTHWHTYTHIFFSSYPTPHTLSHTHTNTHTRTHTRTHTQTHTAYQKPMRLVMVTAPMDKEGAAFYYKNVTLNFYCNFVYRFIRLAGVCVCVCVCVCVLVCGEVWYVRSVYEITILCTSHCIHHTPFYIYCATLQHFIHFTTLHYTTLHYTTLHCRQFHDVQVKEILHERCKCV
jgi:hypothetical protein